MKSAVDDYFQEFDGIELSVAYAINLIKKKICGSTTSHRLLREINAFLNFRKGDILSSERLNK